MFKKNAVLHFPCQFPIKVMGHAASDFEALVVGIVRDYAPDLGEELVSVRVSSKGKYMSVTIRIWATSQRQLDNIYSALSSHERVILVL